MCTSITMRPMVARFCSSLWIFSRSFSMSTHQVEVRLLARDPVGAQLPDERLHLAVRDAPAHRDLDGVPAPPVGDVRGAIHDAAPAGARLEGTPAGPLAQVLGAHVRVRVQLRQNVLLPLVAGVWTQSDQVDPSYWGEVALDQVRVARVCRKALCASLGS